MLLDGVTSASERRGRCEKGGNGGYYGAPHLSCGGRGVDQIGGQRSVAPRQRPEKVMQTYARFVWSLSAKNWCTLDMTLPVTWRRFSMLNATSVRATNELRRVALVRLYAFGGTGLVDSNT